MKAAVAAIVPVEQAPAQAGERAQTPEQKAVAAVSQPLPSVAKSRGVLDNFPHVGPAFNNEAQGSADAAAGKEAERTKGSEEWNKAFAFIHQTDNPLVGEPQDGQGNDLDGAGVKAAAAPSGSPLEDDGFLKGFWGGG